MSSLNPVAHYLLNEDFQQVNQFKLILIESFENPGNFSSISSAASSVGNIAGQATSQALSLFTSTYLLQSVVIPSPVTLEYEESDSKFVKTLKRPENITMSFLETEDAAVWRFLQTWRKQIVGVAPVSLKEVALQAIGQGSENVKYMFEDNQEAAKKTGILLPMGSGPRRIGKFPRIVMHGLRYASNSELTFSNAESGNLVITAEFSLAELGCPLVF